MATLSTLTVKLVGDTADFQESMTKAEKKAESLNKLGDSLTGAGKKLTMGATLPIVGLGLVAVNAASDMEESISKVNVVFGENADAMIEWSEDAATSMGQSQQQALEAVGTYGNLLQSIGVIPDTAADMSKSFVTLASDLASFNNASPEETLLALRSALTGEFEPMKRFGVALSQAAVAQQAMKMGLIETAAELTPAIKAQAGYALIMEQTTLAQGDFILTSDGLANSTRIAKSQFTDAAAAIGQELLPVAMQIVGVVTGWLESFKNLTPHMRKTIVIVLAIVAAIGPLLMIVGTLVSAIGTIIPVVTAVVAVLSGPLLLIIGAVIAVIALLALAWKNNWGDIRGKTKAAIDFIKGVIGSALEWIQDFWADHGEQIMATAQAMWDAVIGIVEWFIGYFETIFEAFSLAFAGDWEGFGEKLREAWDMVWEAIGNIVSTAWEFIKTAVSEGIQAIIKWFNETDWAAVGMSIIQGIASGISAATSWIINAVKSVAGAIWDTLKGFFKIGSPSRLMVDFGMNLMSGWAMGVEKMARLPEMAMQNAITGFSPALSLTSPSAQLVPTGGAGAGTQGTMVVYGGLHLHGVEDGPSLLEALNEVMV